MAKFITGTFVIRAKLRSTKEVVYCGGVRSNNHVLWVPEVEKAVKIANVTKSDLDRYVSDIWHLNEHYNDLDDYASGFNVIDITKQPCNYAAFYGSIDHKSRMIDIGDTTTKVARSIAKDAKVNFPRDQFFLYKRKTKFTGRYLPWKYELISLKTGEHSKDYYFIMEVPK